MNNLFVNIDENGNITKYMLGGIPAEETKFDYWLQVEASQLGNMENYKIIFDGHRPKLIQRD